jgi:murein tripeptide amidase MpaA
LQRSCCSRANQNGPDEYGFRANYQNLDLNRDFIKADSENAKSFIQIFQQWKPHVFVDTHISDGADYTYNMTLIATQKDKLHPLLSKFMQSTWLPSVV